MRREGGGGRGGLGERPSFEVFEARFEEGKGAGEGGIEDESDRRAEGEQTESRGRLGGNEPEAELLLEEPLQTSHRFLK